MKKEDFVAIGISEDLAEKAASASAEELKGLVPRDRLNEAIQERDQLKAAKLQAETDLEELKKSAGDNEALQKQITDLQTAAKQKDADHAEEIKKLRINNAIRSALSGTAQDADIVAGLIDQSKLILGDDGKLTGLDEQLKTLKEQKAFLFKSEESGGKNEANGKSGVGFRVGSTPSGAAGGGVGTEGGQKSMKEAIAEKLQASNAGH